MEKFLETCDPEIKLKAEDLIRKIKSGEEVKRTLPNSFEDFSEADAFRKLDLLTKSGDFKKVTNIAYDR